MAERTDDRDMWCSIALGIVLFIGAATVGATAWWVWEVGTYFDWWGWDGGVRIPPRG